MPPESKPSGNSSDPYYKEQRAKRVDYTDSARINICSDDSSTCYVVIASINHHFDDSDQENTTVTTIHFENGGYLTFGSAPIPGSGTDQHGKNWFLTW
jgi:hypothetical protein